MMNEPKGLAPISIGLIRHSRTLWNEKKILQGQQDSPLSFQGEKMARTWGKQLEPYGWDMILSSDLGRAVATAELINTCLNLPMETNRELREQDWGNWTGLTLAEIKKKEKRRLQRQIAKGWLFTPPGGESREQVLRRTSSAILDFCNHQTYKNILVICHEGVIKCLLYSLLQRQFLPQESKILSPYNLHMLSINNHKISLNKINHHQLTCP